MNSKSNMLPACICRFALVVAFIFLSFSVSGAQTVTLGWDPNDEPDLEGYIVYRNVDSSGPPYSYRDELSEEDLDNPLYPRVTLTGLQEDKKYFVAVTAYDTEGNESNFSNKVCFQIIDSVVSTCNSSAVSGDSSGGGGGGGGGCFISAAGLKNTEPSLQSFFGFQAFESFFFAFSLFLIAAARPIFLKICSKVKADDRFGISVYGKSVNQAIIYI